MAKFTWEEYFARTNPGRTEGTSGYIAEALRQNVAPAENRVVIETVAEVRAPEPAQAVRAPQMAAVQAAVEPQMAHAGASTHYAFTAGASYADTPTNYGPDGNHDRVDTPATPVHRPIVEAHECEVHRPSQPERPGFFAEPQDLAIAPVQETHERDQAPTAQEAECVEPTAVAEPQVEAAITEPIVEAFETEPELEKALEAQPSDEIAETVPAEATTEEVAEPAADAEVLTGPVGSSETPIEATPAEVAPVAEQTLETQPEPAVAVATAAPTEAPKVEQKSKPAPARPTPSVIDTNRQLCELLVQHRLATTEQLAAAMKMQAESGADLAVILTRNKIVTESQILKVQALQHGVQVVDLEHETPAQEVMLKAPSHLCRTHLVLPVRVLGNLLTIGMKDPSDTAALEAIRRATGYRVEPALVWEERLIKLINETHGEKALKDSLATTVRQAEGELREGTGSLKFQVVPTEADTQPVANLVNQVLIWAIRAGASDVHIQPGGESVELRYRVDGDMQSIQQIPLELFPMLVLRLKMMANLDPVEFRKPQNGRFVVRLDGRPIDMKLSVHPTIHGPRIAVEVMDKVATARKLSEIGFSGKDLALFRNMIWQPYGLVLVTGPAGSGRTSTLYSALNELSSTGRNILTSEDLVEYEIDGISQSQTNESQGFDLAAQVSSAMRQDPDVMLLGEIRTKEVADMAISAALEGKLVLSTMHSTDAVGAIPRLLDMGVDPYLLSTCLVGVTAQRLVRALCPKCSRPAPTSEDQKVLAGVLGTGTEFVVHEAAGCPECFGAGFRGRIAVHEVLPITPDISTMIAERQPVARIKAVAGQGGYEPLQVDVVRRVIAGETTLTEATRLVAFDGRTIKGDA